MNSNKNSKTNIKLKEVLILIFVVFIIISVYFSVNKMHKKNQDFFGKQEEVCHELSLISKSIAKSSKSGFENILPDNISGDSLQADKYMRDLFSKKIAYKKLLDDFEYPYFQEKKGYGILLPNKTVIWFKHASNECDDKIPCSILFIDVNNNEKPNKDNYDRMIQKVYKGGIDCKIFSEL